MKSPAVTINYDVSSGEKHAFLTLWVNLWISNFDFFFSAFTSRSSLLLNLFSTIWSRVLSERYIDYLVCCMTSCRWSNHKNSLKSIQTLLLMNFNTCMTPPQNIWPGRTFVLDVVNLKASRRSTTNLRRGRFSVLRWLPIHFCAFIPRCQLQQRLCKPIWCIHLSRNWSSKYAEHSVYTSSTCTHVIFTVAKVIHTQGNS